MKMLDALLRKRKRIISHRTVDGGHPAPYPDMTDEQLYNYETVFNVPNKTFDTPPVSTTSAPPEPIIQDPPLWNASDSARAVALDFDKPMRTITTHHPVEIITTRARHPVYKVHGYIGGDDIVTVFTVDGRLSEQGEPFLENAPEAVSLYLNIYENRDVYSRERYLITQHASREEADACAAKDRLACVSVQWDQ